jgi:hypothetical protein
VRTTQAGALESLGAVLPGPVEPAGRWVAANVRWLRVAALALGVVVLLWGNDISPERWWWSLALVVALLAILQVLVGAADRRRPGPPMVPADAAGPSMPAPVP